MNVKSDRTNLEQPFSENDLAKALNAITRQHGPYSAHNIKLSATVYTMNARVNFDHFKLNRIKQILADLGCINKGARLLDIASLESMFAIEFAAEGLAVTAIEGRENNLEKGRFAAKLLGLSSIEFFLDDVNNITPEKYGRFDIVLCMGILYHIAKEKYASFLKNVSDCCEGWLVIDTFVSLHAADGLEWQGARYNGTTWREFEDSANADEKKMNAHAALNNNLSFSMTKDSLMRFLRALGFTAVFEVQLPPQPNAPLDRVTLVCKRGVPVSLKVFPEFDQSLDPEFIEDTRGIGRKKLVHWNESFAMRTLRRGFRIVRHKVRTLRKRT